MKKSILLLINGFGIEQAGSYSMYSADVMPNLDKLTKEKIFMTIPNSFLDYQSGYRNFSIGINQHLTYNLVENNINGLEYKTNKIVKYIENELNKLEGSKLHVFCYWDSEKTIEQLVTYVKEIYSNVNTKIFIHLILCQKSMNDYKYIERGLHSLNYDMGNNIKIGIVTGENNLYNVENTREIVKSFTTEMGEKWKDVSKKLEVLIQNKTKPFEVRTFAVSYGYKLEENDQILFFNYSNINLDIFNSEMQLQKYRKFDLAKIRYYSLFPTKVSSIPFIYNFACSSTYFLNSLKNIDATCLVMDQKEKCSYINYYFTGLRSDIDDSLKYLPTDSGFVYDSEKLLSVMKEHNRNLYIINFEIDNCKNLEEMKDRLTKIDNVIGDLYKYITENNYTLIISSLYGIETELYNSKLELCKINFSGKVPVVISDSDVSLSNYSTYEGNLYDLANTVLSRMSIDYKEGGLLRKKSNLLSFLYKKPKEKK